MQDLRQSVQQSGGIRDGAEDTVLVIISWITNAHEDDYSTLISENIFLSWRKHYHYFAAQSAYFAKVLTKDIECPNSFDH